MKRLALLVLLGILLVALTGCGRFRLLAVPKTDWKPVVEESPAPPPEAPPVAKLPAAPRKSFDPLAYFTHARGLTDVEQQKEFKVVKQRFAKSAGDDDRWRLILLSLLPGQPFSDREYAVELLHGRKQSGGGADDSRNGLAKLLGLLLSDQRELERKLTEEKQQAETLRRQLEELKEIETILGEREKTRPAGQ
jgi:hypothetical protein